MCALSRSLSLILVAVFCLLLTTAGAEQQPKPSGEMVAKVGNVIITKADLDRRAQQILPMQVSFHGGLDPEKIGEIRQQALDELIERAYQVQYAIEREISIDAATVSEAWQKKLEKSPPLAAKVGTPAADKIRADLYLDLLADKAEEVAVTNNIKVTDQQVSDYYAANKEKFFRPKLFTASHIFVKVEPEENAAEKEVKKARAEELYQRAKAGEDFYNLAYYESDDRTKYVGGSLGSFHAGQTVAEFETALNKLEPGEISPPVRTMYGYHIIKLDKIEEERQLEFDEVAATIRSMLEKQAHEKLYGDWMATLKETYPLERFGP